MWSRPSADAAVAKRSTKAYFDLLLIVLLLLSYVPQPTSANSNGAPTCVSGMPLESPHLQSGYVQLPIDELSPLKVTIESERFGEQSVYLGKPVYVPVNQTITVTVTKLDGPYRGIMTRLEGGDAAADVSAGIVLDFGERDLQYIQICANGNVGITHNSNIEKVEQTFSLFFDTPSKNMRWDMTVVERRVPSRFFYSFFLVNALSDDETPPPTPSPTEAPTVAPTPEPSAAVMMSTPVGGVCTALVALLVALVL